MSVWIGDIRYRLLMLTPVSRWPSSQLLHSAAQWRIQWSAVDHCHCYCCLWQGEETGKRPEAPARCYTAHYYIALHCATLCYTVLYCTAHSQHYIALHTVCPALCVYCTAQQCTARYYTVLHCTALHCTAHCRLWEACRFKNGLFWNHADFG